MKRKFAIALFLLALFLLVMPLAVLAQDEIVTPEEGANQLLTLIVAIINVPFAAAIVVFAVVVLARVQILVFGVTYVSAPILTGLVSALIWVSYAIAQRVGVEQQYRDFFAFLNVFVKNFGPYLASLIGTVYIATEVQVRAARAQGAVRALAAPENSE